MQIFLYEGIRMSNRNANDPINLGVVFYISKGGETIKEIAVHDGDPKASIDLLGERIELGIYSEIVPSVEKQGEYDEIQLPKVNGFQVSTNKDTYILGEPQIEQIVEEDSPEEKARKFHANKKARAEAVTCRVTIITPPLDRREHAEGKTCGECYYFNRRRGQEELKAVTHSYQNGTMSMTEEIIKQICDNEKAPNLTEDIVGHCPQNHELCADSSPACDSFMEKKS